MPTLDKSRPYGTHYGSAHAVYEQDGQQFDGQGNLIGEAKPRPQTLTLNKTSAATQPVAVAPLVTTIGAGKADAQLTKQLSS